MAKQQQKRFRSFKNILRSSTALLVAVSCSIGVGITLIHANTAQAGKLRIQTDDPKSNKPIDMAADEVTYDKETGIVIAKGHVQLNHDGYELIADLVRYDQNAGTVDAEGHIRITDSTGNILLLEKAQLNDTLKEGFVENVRFILSDGSRLAAKDGYRRAGNKTSLNYAVYSPCDVCETKPNKKPLWQIKAVQVTHDEEKKRLFYKNAYLEIAGIPVFYMPFLSHPDPSVDRASGFLMPEIDTKRELGLVVALPYHHVISPSADFTVTPMITTKEGVILGAQARKHFGKGQVQFDGSATYADVRNDFGFKTGGQEIRGHLFSTGNINHKNNWKSNYNLQLASDDTYLRRYGFSKLDTLTSSVTTEKISDRTYMGVRSVWFQGLRIEDIQGLTGFALPMAEYSFSSKPNRRTGGVIKVKANTMAFHRTSGMDTQRLSTSASYEVPYTNSLGQVFRATANLRSDVYNMNDTARPDNPFFAGQDGTEARIVSHLMASFSWPLIKVDNNSQQIIEPIANVVISSNTGNFGEYTNEDSRTFDLSDSNIFSANRFPGTDRWEGGTRFNYGLRWSIAGDIISSEVLLAQSYRVKDDNITFPIGSGLSGHFSDFVGKWDLSYKNLITLSHRFRFDKDKLVIRRNEIDARIGGQKNWLTVGYYQLNRDRENQGLEDREEIRMSGNVQVKQNWTLFVDITQNLTNGRHSIAHGFGLLYRDECLEASLSWRRSFTEDRDIVPGSAIMFRIRLKHLG